VETKNTVLYHISSNSFYAKYETLLQIPMLIITVYIIIKQLLFGIKNLIFNKYIPDIPSLANLTSPLSEVHFNACAERKRTQLVK